MPIPAFAREELMRWCELNGVDYLFGLARNVRLTAAITAELEAARHHSERTGRPARRFTDFMWSTLDSWSRQRRVVAKGESAGWPRRRSTRPSRQPAARGSSCPRSTT